MNNKDLLDPYMPADQLRLLMGELTHRDIAIAREAIRLANNKRVVLTNQTMQDALEKCKPIAPELSDAQLTGILYFAYGVFNPDTRADPVETITSATPTPPSNAGLDDRIKEAMEFAENYETNLRQCNKGREYSEHDFKCLRSILTIKASLRNTTKE